MAGIRPTVWDVRVVKPLDPALVADAAGHHLVVTIEDGLRDGGAGTALADAIAAEASVARRSAPHVEILGIPDRYLAHGKPDDILRDLGLDGSGIAGTVRSLLVRRERRGRRALNDRLRPRKRRRARPLERPGPDTRIGDQPSSVPQMEMKLTQAPG